MFTFSWWHNYWASFWLVTIPWCTLTLIILYFLHNGIKQSDRFPSLSKKFGLYGSILLILGCIYWIVLRFFFAIFVRKNVGVTTYWFLWSLIFFFFYASGHICFMLMITFKHETNIIHAYSEYDDNEINIENQRTP